MKITSQSADPLPPPLGYVRGKKKTAHPFLGRTFKAIFGQLDTLCKYLSYKGSIIASPLSDINLINHIDLPVVQFSPPIPRGQEQL